MAAVSCVFFPFSPASFLAGLINTIGTVAIHAALRASMDKVGTGNQEGMTLLNVVFYCVIFLKYLHTSGGNFATSAEVNYKQKQ
jgi:hypothetical protein